MKVNLEIKALQEALIYTKAAFARLFGVLPKRIRRVMVWAIGFWVWVEGKRPRLYKKGLFREHFARFRQQAARLLNVSQTSSTEFWIKNPIEGTVQYVGYKVDSKGNPRYQCGCEDFAKMSALVEGKPIFKAPACKHIYSVLFYQGFETIAQSKQQHKAEFEARVSLGI